MVRIGLMARQFFRPNRRALMTGLGATSLCLLLPGRSPAQERPPVAIAARRSALPLRSGSPETPVWMLEAPELRFRRGPPRHECEQGDRDDFLHAAFPSGCCGLPGKYIRKK